jgi:monooxygenase
VSIDGQAVNPGERMAYRGVMLSGVPNLAFCIGYANASWTLRADLASRYVCKLLSYMERERYDIATPDADPEGERRPLLDLTSGYVQRALKDFPQQGVRDPWRVRQNYPLDLVVTGRADVRKAMTFRRVARPVLQESAS